jgi:four helix bundle protein
MIAKTHKDLDVYKTAFSAALEIFEITKTFPTEEKYSLTDQIRRSSRSVCANIGEAFRKRQYVKHFISKLSDSEAEAGETQVWLEFALAHSYITQEKYDKLYDAYSHIIAIRIKMESNGSHWALKAKLG